MSGETGEGQLDYDFYSSTVLPYEAALMAAQGVDKRLTEDPGFPEACRQTLAEFTHCVMNTIIQDQQDSKIMAVAENQPVPTETSTSALLRRAAGILLSHYNKKIVATEAQAASGDRSQLDAAREQRLRAEDALTAYILPAIEYGMYSAAGRPANRQKAG